MNEQAIVKFLAEQMGWKLYKGVNPGGGIEMYWEGKDGKSLRGIGEGREKDFDPMSKAEHAWMVVEFIKDDWFKIEWLAGLYNVQFTKPGMKSSEQTYHEHTSENLCEAICVTATLALATDAQLKGWGL